MIVSRLLRSSLLLGLCGCAQRTAGPHEAALAYAAALEKGDARAAYDLMSDAYRARVPFATFDGRWRRDRTELVDDARQARAGLASARLELVLADDRRVPLVRQRKGWRLDEPPLEPYGQASPRQALRSFVRALERRRYDVLIGLAPVRATPELTAASLRTFWQSIEGEEKRERLRLAVEEPIVVEGDEAVLVYAGGRQARLVREDGLWRVETVE